jgi:hypothetical protein
MPTMAQVVQRLPAMCNEDYGLTLHALASWGHQLPDSCLEQYTKEAGRKLYSMSGLGLGLLMAALATYRYSPARDKWWSSLYNECDTKWHTFDRRGLALLLLGLGGLVATAPNVDWQRRWGRWSWLRAALVARCAAAAASRHAAAAAPRHAAAGRGSVCWRRPAGCTAAAAARPLADVVLACNTKQHIDGRLAGRACPATMAYTLQAPLLHIAQLPANPNTSSNGPLLSSHPST